MTDLSVPEHVKDFRAVRQELLRRGLFQTDYKFYAKMGVWCASLLPLTLYIYTHVYTYIVRIDVHTCTCI